MWVRNCYENFVHRSKNMLERGPAGKTFQLMLGHEQTQTLLKACSAKACSCPILIPKHDFPTAFCLRLYVFVKTNFEAKKTADCFSCGVLLKGL